MVVSWLWDGQLSSGTLTQAWLFECFVDLFAQLHCWNRWNAFPGDACTGYGHTNDTGERRAGSG